MAYPGGASNNLGDDGVLIIGQSNASAYGQFPSGKVYDPALQPSNSRVKQWGRKSPWNNLPILADNPLHHCDYIESNTLASTPGGTFSNSTNPGGIGSGLTFGNYLLRRTSAGRDLCLIPAGRGTTTLGNDWQNGATITTNGTSVSAICDSGLNFFNDAVARANAFVQANGQDANGNWRNRLVAIYWLQGESDIIAGNTFSNAYAANLLDLIQRLRSSIIGAGSVPFLAGPIVTDYWAITYTVDGAATAYGGYTSSVGTPGLGTAANVKTVVDALDNIVNVAARTGIIPRSKRNDLTGNISSWINNQAFTNALGVAYTASSGNYQTIHFSATAQIAIGQRLALDALPQAEANALGATVPGQVTGVSIGSIGGTGFTVSWSAVSGASRYAVWVRQTGTTGAWTYVYTGNVTSQAITGLSTSTSYDVQVVAISSAALAGPASVTVTQSTLSGSVFPLTFPGSAGAAPSGNSAITAYSANTLGSNGVTVDGSGNLSLATAFNGGYFVSTANTPDGAVDLVYASGTSTRYGEIMLHSSSDLNNCYYVKHDASHHEIGKSVAGTFTTLLTVPAIVGTETSFGLKIVGSLITYRLNGADTANTVTDSSVANGASRYVGVLSTVNGLKISSINFT